MPCLAFLKRQPFKLSRRDIARGHGDGIAGHRHKLALQPTKRLSGRGCVLRNFE